MTGKATLLPLDVLLLAMRALLDAGKLKEAADIAKAAAPYVHSRVGMGGGRGLADASDEELERDDADGSGADAAAAAAD